MGKIEQIMEFTLTHELEHHYAERDVWPIQSQLT
jgi:hypothetical protein